MKSTEQKLEVLRKIAKTLNDSNINWAVGGSLLLYFKEYVHDFKDIDIMVLDDEAERAAELLSEIGERQNLEYNKYRSEHYYKYIVECVEVDIMGNYYVTKEDNEYKIGLEKEHDIEKMELYGITISLDSVENWHRYYEIMGREDKLSLLDEQQKENICTEKKKRKTHKNNLSPTRVGETRTTKYGQKMTIIRYGKATDIDIQFEDGTIVRNKVYAHFANDLIRNPNLRTGETKMAVCGQKMTIIRYGGWADIDVQFEDGTIVEHKEYVNFARGKIGNPNAKIGKTNHAKNGQKMTIIRYDGISSIDVQFEDGTIVTNKSYDSFKKGSIKNPNYQKPKSQKNKKK